MGSLYVIWSWLTDSSNNNINETYWKVIISISLIVVAVQCFLAISKSKKLIPPLPPGPRGLPIVGYLPFLGYNFHRTFAELAIIYGPIYRLWLGKKLCVVINSPTVVKEVVRDQDKIFSNRDVPISTRAITYGGKDIAFSPYGPYWKKIRKIFVREMLSNSTLDACYAFRRDAIMKTIRNVHRRIGLPVDIGELAFTTSANAIESILWGGTCDGAKGNAIGKEFKQIVAEQVILEGKPNLSDFFPALAWFDIQGIERQAKRIFQCWEKMLDSVVEQGKELISAKEDKTRELAQRKDFLQLLLELQQNGDGENFLTITEVKALLQDIVVAGTETTTTTVEWAMSLLMQNHKAMQKIHEELNEAVGLNNMVEEFHLPKLHYLTAVVKETLRLYPPLPQLIPRSPSQSCTVGGYTIPEGSAVFLNIGSIHKDPKLWDNPLEFQPERFLSDPCKYDFNGNNFQYLPFGSGRRFCAGVPLAERMLIYILASLLHCFEWRLPPGEELDLSDKFGIVVKKLKPMVALPTARLLKLELYE